MTGVLTRSVILLTMNAAVGLAYTAHLDTNRDYFPWETRSALYKIPKANSFGWLFMGSSHAEVFAHCPENVARIRVLLDDDVSYLTKRGSGVFQLRLFLEEFYREGNTAGTVVYFVDPWAFYSRHWNEKMRFIDYEPLDASLMWSLARSGVSPSTLWFYVRSKFTIDWYQLQPRVPENGACLLELEQRNPLMVEGSIRRFFPDGTSSTVLDRYMEELLGIIELTQSNGSELILIAPPTLLGDLPGADEFRNALKELLEPHGIPYHDFSNAVEDAALYHDHDHLNDDGVRYFLDTYLAPVLGRSRAES